MTHSISANNGAGTVTPLLVSGYTPSRQSRNLVHDLLDGSLGVSFIPPRPRSGQLRLLFRTEDDAFEAFNLFGAATSFTYTNTDVPSVGMTFVLDGSVDLDLDALMGNWWVTVGFQEV